jgi:DNA-directed RNA polymerase specialized sigma24 family protein
VFLSRAFPAPVMSIRLQPHQMLPPDAPAPTLEAAALAGDATAWAVLVARHDHKVIVALLARGVRLDRARELAQETWLKLMEQQRLGRLDELTLPGLAIVQAGYLAANDRRRPQGLPLGELPLAELLAAAPGPTAEAIAIDRQQLACVARALADCPPGARRVFMEVYDHPDLAYAEIATRVGLSVQRVKQIVFEVRKRLRQALGEAR